MREDEKHGRHCRTYRPAQRAELSWLGGRLDVIDRQSVAVLVYRRRLHTINLVIRPDRAGRPPIAANLHRDSYNLVHWNEGGLEYWAVSDVESAELDRFRESLRAAIAN